MVTRESYGDQRKLWWPQKVMATTVMVTTESYGDHSYGDHRKLWW